MITKRNCLNSYSIIKLTQRKLATKLSISRNTLRHWIEGKILLPENIFEKIIKIFPESRIYRRYIINELPSNWGQIKGGMMKTNLTTKDRMWIW